MKEFKKNMVSIIVPIYNTERYLNRCIKSLIHQTYNNLEIILIDDGSTDHSLSLCEKYANIDNRIIILNKKNSGVSDSRNKGLELSSGEFVMFVDSDDWMVKDGVENLLKGYLESKTDMIVGNFKNFSFKISKNLYSKNDMRISKTNNKKELLKLLKYTHLATPWGKLFKNSVISKNELSFETDIKYSEDSIFICNYLSNCDSLFCISNIVYNYNCINDESASRKHYLELPIWLNKYLLTLHTLLVKWEINENSVNNLLSIKAFEWLIQSNQEVFCIYGNDKQRAISKIKTNFEVFSKWINSDFIYKNSSYCDYLNNDFETVYNKIKIYSSDSKKDNHIKNMSKKTLLPVLQWLYNHIY